MRAPADREAGRRRRRGRRDRPRCSCCWSWPCCCRRPWRPTCASWAPTPTSPSSSWSASGCCAAPRSAPCSASSPAHSWPMALFEPLGLSSFVLVAGRLLRRAATPRPPTSRRLRAARHVFVGDPGRRASRCLAQFLLGRQVPLGFCVGHGSSRLLVLDTLLAAPLYLLVRCGCGGGERRVRYRRRSSATRRERPRSAPGARQARHPAAVRRPARGDARSASPSCFRRHPLPPVVPADPAASSTWRRPTTTACARAGRWRRAAPSSTATARCWSTTGPAWPSASGPWTCPQASWTDLVKRLCARCCTMKPQRDQATRCVRQVGVPWSQVAAQGSALQYDLVVVKEDVDRRVVSYLLEHTESFPGVEVHQNYLRDYPHGDLAAHMLGNVGEISRTSSSSRATRATRPATSSASGVEWTYDRWLRGLDGRARSRSTPAAAPRQVVPGGRCRSPATTCVLTIDAKVQQPPRTRVNTASTSPTNGELRANGGAAVVLDVHTGAGARHGELPDLRPRVWVGGISSQELEEAQASQHPLLDRAIQEPRPVGSTFKPIDAVAAWRRASSRRQHDVLLPRLLQAADTTTRPSGTAGLPAATARSTSSGDRAVVRRVLLQRRLQLLPAQRHRAGGLGRSASAWASRPASTCPARSPVSCPRRSGRSGHFKTDPGWRSTSSGSPATRSTWPSARATSRRRRCSWPWPTRPSPTAATS